MGGASSGYVMVSVAMIMAKAVVVVAGSGYCGWGNVGCGLKEKMKTRCGYCILC